MCVRVRLQFLNRMGSVCDSDHQAAAGSAALPQIGWRIANFSHGLGRTYTSQFHRFENQVRLWPASCDLVAGDRGIEQARFTPSQPLKDGVHDHTAESGVERDAQSFLLEFCERIHGMWHRLD